MTQTVQPSSASTAAVEVEQLPVYCPNPAMPIWCSHPKVFLDVSKTGQAKCPYCGTVYTLKAGVAVHGH
ncbi:zinc-finger domain-containing protein [Parvibium lacunae]|uniref:Zinc-finger domain-containing protein n=1 Tax=Parvibium lacunae TaxID=1888893 RepID=A0A368L015_9BURK|nr:zinc-finger domain-containing protein [Parvibium lacunae]RCS56734.1 zinc-finger domain-containing protein [Parvibium lacunae]